MFPWVPSNFFLAAVLDALVGQDPSSGTDLPLEGVWLGLVQTSSPPFSPNLLEANIVEATYTGYARQAVVWFPRAVDQLGPAFIQAANLQFRPTDGVVPNNITGFALWSKSVGGAWLLGTLINPAVVLNNTADTVTASPLFQLPVDSIYGRPLYNA